MFPARGTSFVVSLSITALFIAFSTFICSCGGKKIQGVVVDPFGRPVDSVVVQIETSTFRSQTDKHGHYALDYAPGKMVLVFSRPGYTTHEVTLDIQQKMEFPAESLMIYPKPDKPGVYFLSDSGLVALDTTSTWINQGSLTTASVPRYAVSKHFSPDTMLIFIDTDPRDQRLMEISFEGNVAFWGWDGLSRREWSGLRRDSAFQVGRDNMWIRQVRLAEGNYAWVEWWDKAPGTVAPYIVDRGRVYPFRVRKQEPAVAENRPSDPSKTATQPRAEGEVQDELAMKLWNEKKYDEVLAKYPNSPAANMSRDALADVLWADYVRTKDMKKRDDLVMKYPNTTAGMRARNEICKTEMNKALQIADQKAKMAALQAIVKNPSHAGTECAMLAQEEWRKLGGR